MTGDTTTHESRRGFLRQSAYAATALALGRLAWSDPVTEPKPRESGLREAQWYEKLDNGSVRCRLCPRGCVVPPGSRGACRVRENRNGTYYTLVYGRACSVQIDPIEKKPLYHYLPGTNAFSLATGGCNFSCKFCQNWQISQARPENLRYRKLPPAGVIDICRQRNIPTVAYTYCEPTVFSEYSLATAKLGRARGVGSVTISNGFISRGALIDLCRHFTAVKVDLKAFTEKFYRDVCGGRLRPVLNTLTTLRELGMHYEVVVLLIPTLNDSPKEIGRMCAWIVKELGPDVPLHFSRFHPTYRMKNLPPTPVSTLEKAHEIAKTAGVNYCYLGNIGPHKASNTYCPKCKTALIERYGYLVRSVKLVDGKCPKCGHAIPGIWSQKQALDVKSKTLAT